MNSVQRRSQRGNTLIVVLFLLLIITIVGTIAVRHSLFGLKVATNSQAQGLLLQNTDAYFLKLEAANSVQKMINASKFGPIGYAAQDGNIGNEFALCYTRESEQAFNTNQVGVFDTKQSSGKFVGLSKGYCDPTKQTDFTSGRKAVMTQISIKVLNESNPLENFVEGTDTPLVKEPASVRINVVSILPAMAVNVSSSTIIDCLQHYPAEPINGSETITSCLRKNNIPFNAQAADYKQHNAPI